MLFVCMDAQQVHFPQYEFQSTSSIQQTSSYQSTVYEVGAESPAYKSGPRRAIINDDDNPIPNPGYDPSDPYNPSVPVGDGILILIIYSLFWTIYITYKNKWSII